MAFHCQATLAHFCKKSAVTPPDVSSNSLIFLCHSEGEIWPTYLVLILDVVIHWGFHSRGLLTPLNFGTSHVFTFIFLFPVISVVPGFLLCSEALPMRPPKQCSSVTILFISHIPS